MGVSLLARFLLLAAMDEGNHYLLHFNNYEVFECLYKLPTKNGLIALHEWPLDREEEISFFLELICGHVKHYYIYDRKLNRKDYVNLNSM